METNEQETLLIVDAEGTAYLLPWEVVARYRVSQASANPEVSGYGQTGINELIAICQQKAAIANQHPSSSTTTGGTLFTGLIVPSTGLQPSIGVLKPL
jgi:hypothetical protein